MAAAHERGIAVIVDLVLNHTSREHPWFQDALTPGSAHDDWYLWSDDATGWPRGRTGRESGTRPAEPLLLRLLLGGHAGPQPRERRRSSLSSTASAGFWLEEMGVDGFRLDAVKHLIEDGSELENTPETIDVAGGLPRPRSTTDHPDALVLGEVYDASSITSRYVREGALDLTFDFGLASADDHVAQLARRRLDRGGAARGRRGLSARHRWRRS